MTVLQCTAVVVVALLISICVALDLSLSSDGGFPHVITLCCCMLFFGYLAGASGR